MAHGKATQDQDPSTSADKKKRSWPHMQLVVMMNKAPSLMPTCFLSAAAGSSFFFFSFSRLHTQEHWVRCSNRSPIICHFSRVMFGCDDGAHI